MSGTIEDRMINKDGTMVTRKSQMNLQISSSSPSTIGNYLHRHGYRLGKVIGEGSYSKVRLTTRYFTDGTTPSYRLASKVINKTKASKDFVTKFLPRELQIVSRLNHPNIVHVYDVVEFDDHVYIFMDWCDKGDLLEYVKSKGSISENKSQNYFRQLVSAVRYLHNLDLSHRDLKCENILMTSHGEIRISDFGFARSCRDSQGKRILSNTYCGSAAYAAPEILQGTSYNPKLYDMWSLGCVLFIMLTGHMPYDEANIQRMLKHQLERTLTYPTQVYGTISTKAKACIRRLLEPDVTRRANIEQTATDQWVCKSFRVSRPLTAVPAILAPVASVAGDGDANNSVRNNNVELSSVESSHGDHHHNNNNHHHHLLPPIPRKKNIQKAPDPTKVRIKTSTVTSSKDERERPVMEQIVRNHEPRNKFHIRTPTLNGRISGHSNRPATRGTPSGGYINRPRHLY